MWIPRLMTRGWFSSIYPSDKLFISFNSLRRKVSLYVFIIIRGSISNLFKDVNINVGLPLSKFILILKRTYNYQKWRLTLKRLNSDTCLVSQDATPTKDVPRPLCQIINNFFVFDWLSNKAMCFQTESRARLMSFNVVITFIYNPNLKTSLHYSLYTAWFCDK